MSRPITFICSPYSAAGGTGSVEDNLTYARLCLRDSIDRGEAPIAPHLVYPQVLDDDCEEQRETGFDCGLSLIFNGAIKTFAAYVDYGVSKGMALEIEAASRMGIQIFIRKINGGE